MLSEVIKYRSIKNDNTKKILAVRRLHLLTIMPVASDYSNLL